MASRFEKIKQQLENQKNKIKIPESPIEIILFNFLCTYGLYGIPQYEIGKYRADIAFPDKKLVIECDGKEFHSTPEQLAHDATRDKYLQKEGWIVERFRGSSIYQEGKFIVHNLFDKYFTELKDKQVYQELRKELDREIFYHYKTKPKEINQEKFELYRDEMWDLWEEEKNEKFVDAIEYSNQITPTKISNIVTNRLSRLYEI